MDRIELEYTGVWWQGSNPNISPYYRKCYFAELWYRADEVINHLLGDGDVPCGFTLKAVREQEDFLADKQKHLPQSPD